jgi:hypothetical protein
VQQAMQVHLGWHRRGVAGSSTDGAVCCDHPVFDWSGAVCEVFRPVVSGLGAVLMVPDSFLIDVLGRMYVPDVERLSVRLSLCAHVDVRAHRFVRYTVAEVTRLVFWFGVVVFAYGAGVMMVRTDEQLVKDKLRVLADVIQWREQLVGEARREVNPLRFEVCDLATRKRFELHVEHLKVFVRDAGWLVTDEMRRMAATGALNGAGNVVGSIVGHRVSGARWEFQVEWDKVTDGVPVTWELAKRLYVDVPVMVLAYVRRIQSSEQRMTLLELLGVKTRHAVVGARGQQSSTGERK